MFKVFIIACSILMSVNVFSAEQIIAKISCDKDPISKSELIIVTDDKGDILSMKKKAYTLIKSKWEVEYVKEFNDLNALQVSGLLVAEKKARKVAILKSTNFTHHQGGDISLVYLYNGVTGSYRTFKLDLQRRGDHWALVYLAKEVSEIVLVANVSSFFGMIGIREISLK
jgi:hypothetical protein